MIVKRGGRNKHLGFLTAEQREAVEEARDWFHDRNSDPGITLGGLAGTGKTFTAAQVPKHFGLRLSDIAYCSYTGRAAYNLSYKLPKGKGATTIHRLIYKSAEIHCEECPKHGWSPLYGGDEPRCHGFGDCCYYDSRPLIDLDPRPKLIIVDEASMVNEAIYKDLMRFEVPTIFFGDHGQLPPIDGRFDLMRDPDILLTTIHRQLEGSPILKLAYQARQTGKIRVGNYGPGVVKRKSDGYIDVDFSDGWPDLLLLAGKNKTRVQTNKNVRAVRGLPDHPVPGDRVICLRNNWDRDVYNGLTGTIVRCRARGGNYYAVTIRVHDKRNRHYEGVIPAEQFNCDVTLSDIPRRYDLWDYGYCLTVHKAQGTEAHRVVVQEEWLGPPSKHDHKRWLYTAITRARRELEILV